MNPSIYRRGPLSQVMNPTVYRERIGRWNDLATRQIVFQTDDAIEVDEIDHFEIVRKRVYFDDVLLVTIHRQIGTGFVVTMGVFAAIFFVIAWICQLTNSPEAAMILAGIGLPFLLGLIVRLLLKQDVITIYGRRSKAAMKYTFRKTYARDKFDEICGLVQRAQARVAAELPPPEPPVAAVEDEIPRPPLLDPEEPGEGEASREEIPVAESNRVSGSPE
jgi:hypothetical protein